MLRYNSIQRASLITKIVHSYNLFQVYNDSDMLLLDDEAYVLICCFYSTDKDSGMFWIREDLTLKSMKLYYRNHYLGLDMDYYYFIGTYLWNNYYIVPLQPGAGYVHNNLCWLFFASETRDYVGSYISGGGGDVNKAVFKTILGTSNVLNYDARL